MIVTIAINILSLNLFKSYKLVLIVTIFYILFDIFMVFILPIILKYVTKQTLAIYGRWNFF
jgi:hypothetical protein